MLSMLLRWTSTFRAPTLMHQSLNSFRYLIKFPISRKPVKNSLMVCWCAVEIPLRSYSNSNILGWMKFHLKTPPISHKIYIIERTYDCWTTSRLRCMVWDRNIHLWKASGDLISRMKVSIVPLTMDVSQLCPWLRKWRTASLNFSILRSALGRYLAGSRTAFPAWILSAFN